MLRKIAMLASKERFLIAASLVALGVAGRLVPHLPDMTPLTAIALGSSAYIGRKWAFILPVAAMFLSDLVIGFYDLRIMAVVYGSFGLVALLGRFLTPRSGALSIGSTAAGASVLFFLTTNFAVWLFSSLYPKTGSGLMLSYAMGLPFLANMLAGDLVFTFVLLGALKAASRYLFPLPAAQPAPLSALE